MSENKISVTIGADIAQLMEKLEAAKTALSSTSDEMTSLAAETGIAGEAANLFVPELAAIRPVLESSIKLVVDLGVAAADFGAKLQRSSHETGLSVENLSALNVAADHADLTFDQLTDGVSTFGSAMQAGIVSSGTQRQAFAALGITQSDLAAHANDTADMMELVARRLDQYGDGANKQAIVTALFGSKLRDFQPILKDLAENGMEGLRAKAAEVGQLYDGEFADAMKKAHDRSKDFEEASNSLSVELGAKLLPVITAVETTLARLLGSHIGDSEGLAKYQERARDLEQNIIPGLQAKIDSDSGGLARWLDTSHLQTAQRWLTQIKSNIDSLTPDAVKLQRAFENLGVNGGKPFEVIPISLEGKKPDAPSIGNAKDTSADEKEPTRLKREAFEKAIAIYRADAEKYAETSAERTATLRKELATAAAYWGAGSKQYEEIQARINVADRAAANQRRAIMAGETEQFIHNKDQQLSADIAREQTLVANKAVTIEAAAAEEKRLRLETFADEEARLTEAVKLAGDDLALATKLSNQKIQIARTEAKLLGKITETAANDRERKERQADQEIARSGATTIMGLISGRTTLLQTVDSLAERGLQKIIEYGLEELAHHIGITTLTTAATVVGEQEKVGAKIAGAAEGKAVEATAGSVSVLGDAHKAFAGAYAAVAGIPIIGPILAPIAGATAFAAVAAMDIFSAEGGMASIPYDGAMIRGHAREMILPASIATPLRESIARGEMGGAGDGGGMHFHIDMSGASFGAGLQPSQLKAAVVSALKQAHREGAFA